MKTTLAKIRKESPCPDGWQKLRRHLGKTKADDEPLSLEVVLDSNGVRDTIWCLRAVDGYDREKRLFAVWSIRQVQHLMPDQRCIEALDVAERFANGEATIDELDAARDAAYAAAADAAADAAYAASHVAYCVAHETAVAAAHAAAANAAAHAANAAAYVADHDTANVANVAYDTANASAYVAAQTADAQTAYEVAWDAARAAQTAELRRVVVCIEAGQDPYPKGTK